MQLIKQKFKKQKYKVQNILKPKQGMNEYHLLTQLKHDVENKRIKKYQQIKEKSNTKYFELYLNKIIFIQRFFRNNLVSKSLRLERLTMKEVNRNIQSKQKNQNLKFQLTQLKKQRKQLQNIDPNEHAEMYKKQLQNQLKISLKNVFEGADRNAKIKAVLKSEMIGYRQIVKQNQELKKLCQESSCIAQGFKQKNKRLYEKIKLLRNTIADEKTEILILKQKNNKISNFIG